MARRSAGKFKNVGKLVAVLVGDNPASVLYLKKKKELAEKLGVKFELVKLPASSSTKVVIAKIHQLNDDKRIAGIIVQLPLPKGLDTDVIVNAVVPEKDVDGLTDENILSGKVLPATAAGILALLKEYKIDWRDKRIGLVGFTRLLNLPLSLHFVRAGNPVVVLQKGAKNWAELKQADIVITAVGRAGLIKGSQIKTGAVVVDAGVSQVKGKLKGDCDFVTVAKKADYITPVPGGVGPMTVISLLGNLLNLAKK